MTLTKRLCMAALLVYLTCGAAMSAATLSAGEVIDVGTNRQLFVDRYLIHEMRGLKLRLHRPVRREIAVTFDRPWEGNISGEPVIVLKDADLYRMWYRAAGGQGQSPTTSAWLTAYAESRDGIHWKKPSLGVVQFEGSTDNNLVWPVKGERGFAMNVIRDPRTDIPDNERYKAIVLTKQIRDGKLSKAATHGLLSADGIHWRSVQKEPLIPSQPDHMNDGPHSLFWDPWKSQYVIYLRAYWADTPARQQNVNVASRTVKRFVSPDFRNWKGPEWPGIVYGTSPREQFYTTYANAYTRAPGIYLMFPRRFIQERSGLSDIALLSSRDGLHWDRTFREAYIRPGPDSKNWKERGLELGWGIVPTGPHEMSMYLNEYYRTPSNCIRRVSLRTDGFVSVNAPDQGGELITRRIKFQGRWLTLNCATSATGSVRVEILNSFGRPVSGYRLDQSDEIVADKMEQVVTWKGSHDVSQLSGQIVRLRFVMKDADLYAFRFER